MLIESNILAESDPTLKIIIGVIFAGIWVISQIVGALNKSKEKRQPGEVVLPPASPTPREQRSQRQQKSQAKKPQVTQRKSPPPLQSSKRVSAQRAAQAPAASIPMPAPMQRMEAAARKPSIAETSTANPIMRSERFRQVMKPKNLRNVFILSEIIRPPVSMRDDER